MIVKVKEKDIKGSIIVDPAWYRVIIDTVEDKANKQNDGINSWITGRIICNSDTGDKRYEGVPTPYGWLISDKGLFAHLGLFRALGFKEADIADSNLDTAALAGQVVDVFIGQRLSDKGIMQNSIDGRYRTAKQAA